MTFIAVLYNKKMRKRCEFYIPDEKLGYHPLLLFNFDNYARSGEKVHICIELARLLWVHLVKNNYTIVSKIHSDEMFSDLLYIFDDIKYNIKYPTTIKYIGTFNKFKKEFEQNNDCKSNKMGYKIFRNC